MKKVYLVIEEEEYEYTNIIKAFKTKRQAEAFLLENKEKEAKLNEKYGKCNHCKFNMQVPVDDIKDAPKCFKPGNKYKSYEPGTAMTMCSRCAPVTYSEIEPLSMEKVKDEMKNCTIDFNFLQPKNIVNLPTIEVYDCKNVKYYHCKLNTSNWYIKEVKVKE